MPLCTHTWSHHPSCNMDPDRVTPLVTGHSSRHPSPASHSPAVSPGCVGVTNSQMRKPRLKGAQGACPGSSATTHHDMGSLVHDRFPCLVSATQGLGTIASFPTGQSAAGPGTEWVDSKSSCLRGRKERQRGGKTLLPPSTQTRVGPKSPLAFGQPLVPADPKELAVRSNLQQGSQPLWSSFSHLPTTDQPP